MKVKFDTSGPLKGSKNRRKYFYTKERKLLPPGQIYSNLLIDRNHICIIAVALERLERRSGGGIIVGRVSVINLC